MANGFKQDPNIDYPIYASIQNTTATLNTGTEDFLFELPEGHLDWASPDVRAEVSGFEMQSYVGGFTVYAAIDSGLQVALNIRLGTGELLDISDGIIDTYIEGGTQVFVSSHEMMARVGTVSIPTPVLSVNVTGVQMTTGTSSVNVTGVPFWLIEVTGLEMVASVGRAFFFSWGEVTDDRPDKWTNARSDPLEAWVARGHTSTSDNWIRKRGHA